MTLVTSTEESFREQQITNKLKIRNTENCQLYDVCFYSEVIHLTTGLYHCVVIHK
jgi:hypothetical protein